MQKIMVYSESGGVSKTTTAVSLAMTAALEGKRTVLIDLDPRGAATRSAIGLASKPTVHPVG
jgi:chromosome partitioning protein